MDPHADLHAAINKNPTTKEECERLCTEPLRHNPGCPGSFPDPENPSGCLPDSDDDSQELPLETIATRPDPNEKGWKLDHVVETLPEWYCYKHEDGRVHETTKPIEFIEEANYKQATSEIKGIIEEEAKQRRKRKAKENLLSEPDKLVQLGMRVFKLARRHYERQTTALERMADSLVLIAGPDHKHRDGTIHQGRNDELIMAAHQRLQVAEKKLEEDVRTAKEEDEEIKRILEEAGFK
jgi:hypothetical protein